MRHEPSRRVGTLSLLILALGLGSTVRVEADDAARRAQQASIATTNAFDADAVTVNPAVAARGSALERNTAEAADKEAERIDLNHASEKELTELPGIGEGRAKAIVAYRSQRGGFHSINELLRVRGIGRKLFAKLRPHVTVDGPSAGQKGTQQVR